MRKLTAQDLFVSKVEASPASTRITAEFTGSATRAVCVRTRQVGDTLLLQVWGSELWGKPQVEVSTPARGEPVRTVAVVQDWSGPHAVAWSSGD